MGRTALKKERHEFLLKLIEQNPFLKDEELAESAGVSVATIRVDRAELGIAQYRERIKNAAQSGLENARPEVKDELLDLNLYHDGIAVMETDESMLFEGTDMVKSQCIYAFAENLALSVIDARAAIVKVANVKYVREVHSGEKLMAKSEVVRTDGGRFIVHVMIKSNLSEVFRGKYSLRVMD